MSSNAAASLVTATERLAVRAPRTGYVFDVRMCGHEEDGHPERPQRILRIHDELEAQGLLARCQQVPIRDVTREELLTIHTPAHCDAMDSLDKLSDRDRDIMATSYNSLYFNAKSLESAKLAAGGTVAITEAVMKGTVDNGVAIVRPPGHHAEAHEAMGFCLYNQVAVAAALARQKWGAQRVAIIDWDVHFGNGTYNSFASDDSILYVSTHRYESGRFYPGGKEAAPQTVGKGKGTGYSVNVGWQSGGIGDGGYLAAFETVIMPICREFNPDLVLISAGFDAAAGDPLGGCEITPRAYAHMTRMLTTLAHGRIVLVLEGGYNLAAISKSFAACTSVLLGDESPSLPMVPPERASADAIMETVNAHRGFWKCLKDVKSVTTFPGYINTKDRLPPKQSSSFTTPESSPARRGDRSAPAVVITATPTPPSPAPIAKASGSPASSSPSSSSASGSSGSSASGSSGASASASGSSGASASTSGSSASSASGSSASGSSASASSAGGSAADDDKYNEETGFAVEPLPWCPHLDSLPEVPRADEIKVNAPCAYCQDTSENWVCLHCMVVLCSRFVREHMLMHYQGNHEHTLALSFSDISIWCYECDAYVHNDKLQPYKQSAYRQKFG